jgi:hypothetical protein
MSSTLSLLVVEAVGNLVEGPEVAVRAVIAMQQVLQFLLARPLPLL